MWHQSMNKSFLDRHNSVLNVAHSEPLRHGTVKDAVRLFLGGDFLGFHLNIDFLLNWQNLNDKDDRTKPPPCSNRSNNFRHYCSYKEDYPTEMVAKLIKYYKYPLESMFKELRVQVMPPLAKDDKGEMVCSSVTQLIRVGWAMDTNGRWFVVLNQDHYHQYITEVICRHGNGSNCNFVAPCFRAKCLQRFNTQKLLVIDPYDPYKGPFMSEFLFPSCCVCHLETSKWKPHWKVLYN